MAPRIPHKTYRFPAWLRGPRGEKTRVGLLRRKFRDSGVVGTARRRATSIDLAIQRGVLAIPRGGR
eukprot:9227540-Lingulodinium_polyedra.AAC.1